ncbi:MAG: peptide deformylase [Gammaproteobacteria bacterium]
MTLILQTLDTHHPQAHILRQKAAAIAVPLNSEQIEFAKALQQKMIDDNGFGLAAPQVGYSWRVIAIQLPIEALRLRQNPLCAPLPPHVLINPEYQPNETAGKNKDWEGCFSVPEQVAEVWRYTEIDYQAYTLEGEKIYGIARGMHARVLQHEIDHLDGILLTDRTTFDCQSMTRDEYIAMRQAQLARQNHVSPDS